MWWTVYAVGLAFTIVPPAIAVLLKYSLWQTGQRVSAITAVLLVVCCVPMWRQIKYGLKKFAENPSAPGVWLVPLVTFFVFDKLADDMLSICYIGFIASVIGAAIMGLAKKKLSDE